MMTAMSAVPQILRIPLVGLAAVVMATVAAAAGDDGLGILRGSIDLATTPTSVATVATTPMLPMPGGLPDIAIRSLLIGLHLIGFAIGLGGVTMLDFWIVRWMRGVPVTAEIVRTFQFVSKAISVGLALLWASGIGFLALYAAAMPDLLQNPKLWAKIAIVAVLTLDGAIIHRRILPALVADIGGPLFSSYPALRRSLLFAAGAVSGVSWYAAFALGTFKEFNEVVPFETLIGLWLAAVLTAWAAAESGWRFYAARRFGARATPVVAGGSGMPSPSPVAALVGRVAAYASQGRTDAAPRKRATG